METATPITVRNYGTGPRTVVLLHGGPGAPGYMAPLARSLATDFRVLEPLQRRANGLRLSVARHVQDLAEVAPGDALLLGSSWGAMLALSYAASHPDRVRGLVLVGCGTYDEDSRRIYQESMAGRLGADGAQRIATLNEQLEAAADRDEQDRLFGEIGDLCSQAQGHDLLTTDFEVVRTDRRGHHETWEDVLRLQAEGREPADFAVIQAPVLMVHGSEDPHPGQATRDTLRAYVPQLEYVELPRCGHIPWFERYGRDPFLELLRTWLAAHAPGAA